MFWCHVGLCRSHRQPCQHCRHARTLPHRPSPSSRHHVITCPWVAIALFIAVEEPLRRPLPLPHAIHCFQVAVAPSIAVHRRQVHCRCVAVAPSITVSIAIELLPFCCPLLSLPSSHLSPSNCCCTVHRPSPASIHCHCAVNCHWAVHLRQAVHRRCALNRRLSSGWLLCPLSSHQHLPLVRSTNVCFFLLVGSTNSTICNWWGLKYIMVSSFVRFTNVCFLWG